jgi:hypothetical protein
MELFFIMSLHSPNASRYRVTSLAASFDTETTQRQILFDHLTFITTFEDELIDFSD